MLIFEAPLPTGAFSNAQTARRLLALACEAEKLAAKHSIACFETHVSTVKKRWTGTGNAKKHHMVQEAIDRGFDPKDDNEADAIAVLNVAATDLHIGKQRRMALTAAEEGGAPDAA